jgi:predicted  nucleic acid-binding Zn-ribbon protein
MMCDLETEVKRRIERNRNGESGMSQEEIRNTCIERNEQFEAFVIPEKHKFELELRSLVDYAFEVRKDDLGVF